MSYKIKLLLLLFGGIFFAFLLIIFIVSLFIQGDEMKQTPFPQPTQVSSQSFRVALFSPGENVLLSLAVISSITLEFSQPLDPESFVYEITPAVDVETELDESGKKLTFAPELFWIPNTLYTLTIRSAQSQEGSILAQPYVLNFRAINTADDADASDAESNNNP